MWINLLPRPEDPKYDWGQHKEFFPINVEHIRKNLAPADYLAPEGIASPWGRLEFMDWILQVQKSPKGEEGVEVLQLIVLLQFLGHLEANLVMVSGGGKLGWLGTVLESSVRAQGVQSVVLWKIRSLGAEWEGQAFAGSHPACPFFPGAAFFPDLGQMTAGVAREHIPAWRRVRNALVARRGPDSDVHLLDGQGDVADPDLAASLSHYLGDFTRIAPQSGWGVALESWRHRLGGVASSLGGRVLPTALSGLSMGLETTAGSPATISFGVFTGGRHPDIWVCPACMREDRAWINVPGDQSVSSGRPDVWCPQHRTQIQIGAGTPVGPTEYGAYPAPDGTLYVWTDEVARPAGCTASEVSGRPGSEGSVVYRFNRQSLKVTGRLISLETVLLKNAAWVSKGNNQQPQPVDVPVPGEYATLVEKCDREDLNRRWMIKFRGLRDPVSVPFPVAGTLWNTSAIVVWPPRDLGGWTIDYVGASTKRIGGNPRFRIIEEGSDGTLVASAVLTTNSLCRTARGKAKYIELGEILAGGTFRSLGLLLINRDPARVEAGGHGLIVLDLGTSNSAVLWRLPESTRSEFICSGVPEADLSNSAYFRTEGREHFGNLLRAVAILSQWNPEKNPRRFLPSLLANPDPSAEGSVPCIPPRELGLALLTGPKSRVVSGLKWKDWSASGVLDRLRSLLELLLLPAFWALRMEGCGYVSLTATYPLAFDGRRRELYRQVLKGAVDTLSERTGLHVRPLGERQDIVFVSESAAGCALLPRAQKTHEAAIDMGGGTTDIAILIGAAGGRMYGRPSGTVLAADSIEYAGRDFLRAIVIAYSPELLHRLLPDRSLDLLPDGISPPNPEEFAGMVDELHEAYVECLEAVLHRRGPGGLYDLLSHVPSGLTELEIKQKLSELKVRWEVLLSGLLFYIRRMVEACASEAPEGETLDVSFNLLGQGWELLRLLGDNISRPVYDVLRPRLLSVAVGVTPSRPSNFSCEVQALPTIQNAKTAVVEGADRIWNLPGARFEDEPSPGPLANPFAANVRRTFVGMTILGERGKAVFDWRARLEDVIGKKPDWPGDPGYGGLLDELLAAIPESFHGTNIPFRPLAQRMLLESVTYRRQFATDDVRRHLIIRGQNDLNGVNTWPSKDQAPARSLLAGFLTSVWRPVWAATKL